MSSLLNNSGSDRGESLSSTPNHNFFIGAGNIKKLIYSFLYDFLPQTNLVQESTISIDDNLRSRGGAFWTSQNNNPLYALPFAESKKGFAINFKTSSINTSSLFPEEIQEIELVANKNLFKFNPGNPLVIRPTFNRAYWRTYITGSGEQPEITPTLEQQIRGNSPRPDTQTTNVGTDNASFSVITPGSNQAGQQTTISSGVSVAGSTPSLSQGPPSAQSANTQPSIHSPNVEATRTDGLEIDVNFNNRFYNIKATIDDKRFYEDFVFESNVPFSPEEQKKMNASLGTLTGDTSFHYNFFIDAYESAIAGNSIDEKVIPNFYSLIFEYLGKNKDEQNSFYQKHITLFNLIEDAFVDVLNSKGEKIDEKDKGQYFEKYADKIGTFISQKQNEEALLRTKYSNIVIPLSDVASVKDFDSKKLLMPMYNEIKFSTDNSTQMAEALKESKLYTSLMKDIIDQSLPSFSRNYKEFLTLTTQIGNSVEKRTSIESKNIRYWSLDDWINYLTSNPLGTFADLRNGVFLGTMNDEVSASGRSEFALFKNIFVLILVGKIRQTLKNYWRTYEQMYKGKPAYTETLFYRIEKTNSSTGDVIQNIWIPNSNEVDVFSYIDTQVKYDRKYSYKVFAHQAVVGNIYSYSLLNVLEDTARVEVKNTSSIRIVEIEYFKEEERTIDSPPISPDVNVIPYKGDDNELLFWFNSGSGRKIEKPVIIEGGDTALFSKVRQAQKKSDDEAIEFNSDDHASGFEVFRMDKLPSSYADFNGNKIKIVNTDISAVSLQKATGASFIDNISGNKKYYYTFRAIDNHGHISNPSPVYQIELVNNNGSIYPVIEIVNFRSKEEDKVKIKSFRKLLQIKPALNQTLLNENKSGLIINGERVESIVGKDQFFLGIEKESLWNKTFKIRITSKNTGKKIDINVPFEVRPLKKESK